MAPGSSGKAPRAKLDLSPDKVKGKGAESNRKAPQTPKESHRKKPALKKKAGSSKDLVGETSAEGAEEAAPEGRPSSPVPEPEQLPVAEEQSEVAELKALLGGRTDPAKEPVEAAAAPSPAVVDAAAPAAVEAARVGEFGMGGRCVGGDGHQIEVEQ